MAKKQLNTAGIVNELEHSSFFSPPQPSTPPQPVSPAVTTPLVQQEPASSPRAPERKKASVHASKHASTLATPASDPSSSPDPIEAIRKAVKQIGKEVSFVRLTPEEKRQLKDIAYTYQRQGLKTSENEISRIGINYMLQDYHANGRASILAQVLEALNA
jgi:hypothetical protein